MKDNISRSSIFRDSMRVAAEKKKKEEQEKHIKVGVIGNIEKKPKATTLMKAIQQISTNEEKENIGKEPGE